MDDLLRRSTYLCVLRYMVECGIAYFIESVNRDFLAVLRRCRNSFLDKNNNNGEKPASFAKTLTQSDANNGGGFSVPRYCAVTIFPRLDYSTEPPIQTIIAKDVYGQCWKFRHIYKGTPRRYLLTTGWSNFVNHKKLIAGDSIVFL
ncbi:hypothetical protein Ahy_B05g078122 [Arachis hypogaea]|uniref:TF-B3 domain-containing protein n=1 Tax=Arachis hypogaea TaxID=3818 RepID=A0A444Z6D5_ARAHY|nr:hypothetical protein Ahy_B05g078122 [Arachis hypogaea]